MYMYVIIGLGNPTSKYEGTRHNIGFEVIDELASQMGISVNTNKHKALCGVGLIGANKVLLIKPQTFMNLSGESVRAAVDFYKVNIQDEIIVIYDDISLPVGKLRVRSKGSAGGHNGMKSIISHLGTDQFARIKVGVGNRENGRNLADYVLGKFMPDERVIMKDSVKNAASATSVIILEDIATSANKFN